MLSNETSCLRENYIISIPVIKATLAINNKPSNITKYTSEIRLMSNLVFFCCYTSCSAKSTSFCLYCSLAAPVNVIYGLWWTDLLLPLLILYTFASSRTSLIVLCSWGFSVWSINVIQMYCVVGETLTCEIWKKKKKNKLTSSTPLALWEAVEPMRYKEK